jgi:hypothetical protein
LPEIFASFQLAAGWLRDLLQAERGLVLSTPNVQLAILLLTTNVSCLLQGNFNATVRCDIILAATFLLWKSVAWEEFLKEVRNHATKEMNIEVHLRDEGGA